MTENASRVLDTLTTLRTNHPDLAECLTHVTASELAARPQASWPDSATIPKWGRMGPPIYVIGTPEATTLEQWINTLRERSDQPIVILEADHEYQLSAFCRDTPRWETLWQNTSIHWSTQPVTAAACSQVFKNDEAFTFLQSPIIPGYVSEANNTTLCEFQAEAKAMLDAQLQRYQQQANDFLAWRQARPNLKTLSPNETHVVGFVDQNTTALIHVAKDVLDGAKENGYRVTLHIEDHQTDPFLQYRRLQRLTSSEADLLFSPIMPTRRSFADLADATPSLVYFSSDPQRYGISKDVFGKQDHAIVVAPSWEQHFKAINVPCTTTPLASTMKRDESSSDDSRWQCDAVMVGNLTGGDYGLAQQPDAIRQHIVELAKALVETDSTALTLLNNSALTVGDVYKPALCRTIEIMATDMLRIQVVVALAQAGLNIKIYGSTAWQEALVDTPALEAYQGPLDYINEVPHAYTQANCAINVTSFNAHDGLPMRVFDVPHVGGVLVSNFTDGLTQCLTPGEHVLTWQTATQAVELVQGLKQQPELREKLSSAGQAHALTHHTYASRWQTMMTAITSD